MKKVTKYDLSIVFQQALNNYISYDAKKRDLDNQQFVSFCYLKAFCTVLQLDYEVEERKLLDNYEELTATEEKDDAS